jgi:uncharacterized lipoprotein YddW (UPF0748 family)
MNKLLHCHIIMMFVVSSVSSQTLPLKREVRGAWIATVANIDWPSSNSSSVATQQQQLISILDQLSAAGVNVAIFQVRPECDALYQSSFEPWSYWLTGTQGLAPNPIWDPLTFAVSEAHKRGMELHAWFNPYRAERSAGNYTTAMTHVTKTHSGWVLQVGSVKFLDPGLQVVRDYVSKVISDVVRRYDIDAAHMDDYFYVQGISTQDAATFAANPRGFQASQVGDWRRDNVNLLVKQIYDSIQVIKPWVKWGISPAGIWKSGVPPGIVGNDNYSVIYCDAVAWMAGKYIDYLAPQLYWKIGGSQDFTLLLPWWQSVANGRPIYPGLAAYRINVSGYGPASEVANQIRFERATTPHAGNFLYTTNNLTGNTGGITDSLTNNLYQYPALVPSTKGKDSIPPNPPANVRFDRYGSSPYARVQWNTPAKAPDNDTASMYVIYQTSNASVSQSDIDDARNISKVTNQNIFDPLQSKKTFLNFTVTALDKNKNESAPSSVLKISNPPVQPLLAYPQQNSNNQTSTVLLGWNYASGSSGYKLQIATDSNFAVNLGPSNFIYDSVWQVTNLPGRQNYYWKVKGMNPAGEGSYSPTRSFFTAIPATPLLAIPANHAPTEEYTSLKFLWNKAEAAQSYRLQVSADLNFASFFADTIGLTDTSFSVKNLTPYTIYNWRISAMNAAGTSLWSAVFNLRTKALTSVSSIAGIPDKFELYQNYPNPFNPETNMRFTLVESGYTTLKVYSILGSEIATLVNGSLNAGTHTIVFRSTGLPSGVYVYRLISGKYVETRKMVLLK